MEGVAEMGEAQGLRETQNTQTTNGVQHHQQHHHQGQSPPLSLPHPHLRDQSRAIWRDRSNRFARRRARPRLDLFDRTPVNHHALFRQRRRRSGISNCDEDAPRRRTGVKRREAPPLAEHVALLHAATHHLRRARRKPPRARVSPARPFSQAIPSLTHRDVACSALELGSDSEDEDSAAAGSDDTEMMPGFGASDTMVNINLILDSSKNTKVSACAYPARLNVKLKYLRLGLFEDWDGIADVSNEEVLNTTIYELQRAALEQLPDLLPNDPQLNWVPHQMPA